VEMSATTQITPEMIEEAVRDLMAHGFSEETARSQAPFCFGVQDAIDADDTLSQRFFGEPPPEATVDTAKMLLRGIARKYNTHHGEHGHFASTGGGKGKAGDSGEAPVSSASKPDPHGPKYKSLDEYEKSDEGRKIKSLIDEGNLNDVHTGDGALRVAMDRAGFSGKPKVVSKKEMDALIASGSHIEVFRGFGKDADSAAHAEQYRSGEHYAGKGTFGNGTYTTTLRTTAQKYANKPGALVRMAIPRDAHMIDYLDRQKRIVEPNLDRHAKEEEGIRKKLRATKMTDDDLYTALNRKTMNNALYNNEAVAAVHHGYDVVHVPARPGGDGEEFYVVLNRSKMVVQKGAG
jgi:hypothetical protein